MIQPIPIALAHTPAWKDARKTGIGASRAGASCGISRFGTPLTVYEEVTAQDDSLKVDDIHTRFGKHVEPAIVSMYQEEFGVDLVYPIRMHRHGDPAKHFMLATPDAMESDRVGVEIKTIDEYYARHLDVVNVNFEDACPDYVLQAQQQCEVMNWDLVKIVMLIGKKLHVFPIERDDEMIAMIAAHEQDLWDNHIVPRIQPFPTSHLDLDTFRRRKSIVGNVVGLSEDASAKWSEYELLGDEINEFKERRELLKAQVLHEIGDAPAGLLTTGDFMIRRKMTKRAGYSVNACEFLDARKVKYDGSPISAPVPSESNSAA